MLSEAKHLLLFEYVGDKQILRFAQNDNLCVYTIRRNALVNVCLLRCQVKLEISARSHASGNHLSGGSTGKT